MSGNGPSLTPTQRAAAVERIGENLVLLSGAGCGKTFVLARRFTELLLRSRDESPLSRLVALTFTDKAALEMAQRVEKMLRDLSREAPEADRDRLLDWLEQLPEARISTIHSFCSGLLRAKAVEAGVAPEFTVSGDSPQTSQMIADAAEEAILSALNDRPDELAPLLAELSFEDAQEEVGELVKGRSRWNPADYSAPAAILERWKLLLERTRKEVRSRLLADAGLLRLVKELDAAPCRDPADKLEPLRRQKLAAARQVLQEGWWTPEAFQQLSASCGNFGTQSAWGSKDAVSRMRRGLKELASRLVPYADLAGTFNQQDERAAGVLAELVRLAQDARKILDRQKRRQGLLDFDDLLLHVRSLLEGPSAARRDLARQIDQLLVDEAQDTDSLQVELLELLAFPAGKADRSAEGRFFLVGDPKQSIYRFRGAQVEVFEDLCARLGPGKQETLDQSFRTHEAGTEFVNHLFAPLMGDRYSPIRAHRKESPPGPSVEILLAEGTEEAPIDRAALATRAQAQLTAERIARMLEGKERLVRDRDAGDWRPVRPGDIAILFSRMTVSLEYERQLALRDVPYYVVTGTGFFQQQEVRDVLNALRVIDNPFDDISLMGVLRSSLFGLDDNDLLHVAEGCSRPYLPALAEATSLPLGPDRRHLVRRAVELLARLHRQKDAVTIDAILQQLLDETGYEASLFAWPQGRRAVGNVRMLLDQARQAQEGSLALADFIARVDEMTLRETRAEQAAVAGEAQDVVRLMTVHKAKGLEFPVVFLPDLNATRQSPKEAVLLRRDWGLTCRIQSDENGGDETDKPLSYRVAVNLEREDQDREEVRRFYVAATRHQDYLVFVGAHQRNRDNEYAEGSCLSMMDGVLDMGSALDRGERTIPYAKGRFHALLQLVRPRPAAVAGRGRSAGARLLRTVASEAELAEKIQDLAKDSAGVPPLLGPLAMQVGKVELAVTALCDFAYCPTLYRWRHELLVPVPEPAARAAAPPASGLDAATRGTLYHLCMQDLDFLHPQEARRLVSEAAARLDLAEPLDLELAARELESMLEDLRGHPLWQSLRRSPRMLRELDFVLDLEGATLRGQIDLLYRDAEGAWHVVDYKSDRVARDEVAGHAARYELQVAVYAEAARRVQPGLADASLYFLRPAVLHVFPQTPASPDALRRRLRELAGDLVRCRRRQTFPRSRNCARSCPYRGLCEKQPGRS